MTCIRNRLLEGHLLKAISSPFQAFNYDFVDLIIYTYFFGNKA